MPRGEQIDRNILPSGHNKPRMALSFVKISAVVDAETTWNSFINSNYAPAPHLNLSTNAILPNLFPKASQAQNFGSRRHLPPILPSTSPPSTFPLPLHPSRTPTSRKPFRNPPDIRPLLPSRLLSRFPPLPPPLLNPMPQYVLDSLFLNPSFRLNQTGCQASSLAHDITLRWQHSLLYERLHAWSAK